MTTHVAQFWGGPCDGQEVILENPIDRVGFQMKPDFSLEDTVTPDPTDLFYIRDDKPSRIGQYTTLWVYRVQRGKEAPA